VNTFIKKTLKLKHYRHNLFWKTADVPLECKICYKIIPAKEKLVEAYDHCLCNAFLSLINICTECAEEITKENGQIINERG